MRVPLPEVRKIASVLSPDTRFLYAAAAPSKRSLSPDVATRIASDGRDQHREIGIDMLRFASAAQLSNWESWQTP